jgi:hypothetical protein
VGWSDIEPWEPVVAQLRMAVQVAVAAYAYAPTNTGDLTLQQGDRIEVRSVTPTTQEGQLKAQPVAALVSAHL